MADQVVSDGIPGISDEGLPGVSDGSEDWGSAALRMVLALAVDSDSYVRSSSELDFTNHDGTNDQVDVNAGIAYLDLSGETVNYQSGFGGSSPPNYDTALPTLPAIPVIVPTAVSNVDLQDSTLSDIWLAYATDGTVSGVDAGDVYIRSDDTGSVSAPSHPNVKLGEVNPDNASADVLSNRGASPTFESTTIDQLNGGVTGSLAVGKIFGERIESQSPSGVSAAEFTSGIGSDYDIYQFEVADLVPATDGTALTVQVSTDGGSSWKTGNSDYSWSEQHTSSTGGEANSGNGSDSHIELSGNIGSESGEGYTGTVKFSNPANGSLAQMFRSYGAYQDTGGNMAVPIAGGAYSTAEAIDGVRFKFASGNIESGDIDLYGVMT